MEQKLSIFKEKLMQAVGGGGAIVQAADLTCAVSKSDNTNQVLQPFKSFSIISNNRSGFYLCGDAAESNQKSREEMGLQSLF